jgi:hypothetical protein
MLTLSLVVAAPLAVAWLMGVMCPPEPEPGYAHAPRHGEHHGRPVTIVHGSPAHSHILVDLTDHGTGNSLVASAPLPSPSGSWAALAASLVAGMFLAPQRRRRASPAQQPASYQPTIPLPPPRSLRLAHG